MTPAEFMAARLEFGLGRKEFALLLGYTGEARNNWITMKRYETGGRPIPPTIERLVRLLAWHKADFGYLPDLDADGRVPLVLSDEVCDG